MIPSTRSRLAAAALGIAGASLLAASPARADVTTFENGTEGWSVSGRDNLSTTGGNPGANMDVEVLDVFGINVQNNTNAAFIGDYTRFGTDVVFSVDLKVNSIWMNGFDGPVEVPRNFIIELVDYNPPGSDYPWVSVWFNFGEISSELPGWRHFEVSVDPTALALPAGWGGTGAENEFGEPLLPADRTFASVLASVDEMRFTSYEPGWFYGFTNFVIQVDNPTLRAVPEPSAALAGCALLGGLLMRRRPSRR